MEKEYEEQWERDCLIDRGKVLDGKYCHWCPEWDGLTVDETCFEWPCGCTFQLRRAPDAVE